jgi:hypothetical protein
MDTAAARPLPLFGEEIFLQFRLRFLYLDGREPVGRGGAQMLMAGALVKTLRQGGYVRHSSRQFTRGTAGRVNCKP